MRRTQSVTAMRRGPLLLGALCALAMTTPLAAQRQGAARKSVSGAYDPIFRKYSKRYFSIAFDWRHFKAQAMAESRLDPKAISRVGARGVMQLMPSTFKLIASRRTEFVSIDDPEWNIAAGILHDRDTWRMWEKTVPADSRHPFMFATYNAGEGPITRAAARARAKKLNHTQWPSIEQVAPEIPRWRYRETLDYVRKIAGNYKQLLGAE
ncbi:MAG: transglycosylase SLT domain-containing protein [Gemmatimonadaceae bacterium]|nr:transglycosylase SLT domain-containing protein [Gemmatimonadaceae bacterium]